MGMLALLAALLIATPPAAQPIATAPPPSGIEILALREPGHFRIWAHRDHAKATQGASVFVRVRGADGTTVMTRTIRTTATNGWISSQDFSLDLSAFAAGVYSLTAALPVGAFTVDGQPLGSLVSDEALRLYVPRGPMTRPEMTIGQRYLYFPEVDDNFYSIDPGEGAPTVAPLDPPFHDQAIRELAISAIRRLDSDTTIVYRDLHSGAATTMAVKPSLWPPVKPEVEDEVLAHLRAEYEGKRVWHYAGGWSTCPWAEPGNGTSDGIDLQPVRIKRIVRLYAGPYSLPLSAMPSATAASLLNREGGFVTWTPIVVFLDLHDPMSGRWMPNPASGQETAWRCLIPWYTMFADRWDFERVFSPTPPAHPPVAIHVGMTKDDVLWSLGFPLSYGTRAQVLPLDTWQYEHVPPFHYWVYFKHGKVVKFGEDGHPGM
jgi:hypothetical protein